MGKEKILVVGASSGIAKAVVRDYASHGNDFILTSRNKIEAKRLATDAEIRGARNSLGLQFDPSNTNARNEFIKEVFIQWPKGPTIVLICYGICIRQSEITLNPELALNQILINLGSLVVFCEALFPKLSSGATVAVLSSVAGDRARQSNYVYGASKAGLNAYLDGLRLRGLKENKAVLIIKPGLVDTPMTAKIAANSSFLLRAPEDVSKDIIKAIKLKRSVLYTPWFWRPIMTIIKNIPEKIFKHLKF